MDASDLPTPTTTSTEIQAAQQYCTAVVENEKEAANIPRYSEYMAKLRGGGVKRNGDSVEDLEAAAKDEGK